MPDGQNFLIVLGKSNSLFTMYNYGIIVYNSWLMMFYNFEIVLSIWYDISVHVIELDEIVYSSIIKLYVLLIDMMTANIKC